jgi:hypothetical protein
VNLAAPNPGAGSLPGAVVFPQAAGPGSPFGGNDFSAYGPRFGFAYRFTPKTVIRGGYGLYYSDLGLTLVTAGFQPQANYASTNNGISPAFILQSGFPDAASLNPARNPSILNGQNGSFFAPNATAMPRVQEWSINLQRELPGQLLFEASYIGNKGHRLLDAQMSNVNQLDPRYLSLGSLLTQSITSPGAIAAGISSPYPGFSGTVAQALRPYPQYRTLTSIGAKEGASRYNALQVVLKKRLSFGLTVDASYVFSRLMGYHSPSATLPGAIDNVLQNAQDRKAEWALLPSDLTHAVVFNYVYTLPYKPSNKILNLMLGGWSIAGIHRYQSGFPLSIVANNSLPVFNRVLRPNRVDGVNPATNVSLGDWKSGFSTVINRAAFTQPAPFTFGTSKPTYAGLRSFPILNEDLALSRRITIREGFAATLYGQFFNVLNRHRFTAIDTNFNSASFGQAGGVSQPRFIQLGVRLQF